MTTGTTAATDKRAVDQLDRLHMGALLDLTVLASRSTGHDGSRKCSKTRAYAIKDSPGSFHPVVWTTSASSVDAPTTSGGLVEHGGGSRQMSDGAYDAEAHLDRLGVETNR